LDDNGSVVDISFKNRKRNQSAREANNQYSENEGVIDATTAKK